MLSSAQCRAARALVDWSRDRLAEAAHTEAAVIQRFEHKFSAPDGPTKLRIREALEAAGAVFLPEKDGAGEGVRLKFSRPGVRAVQRWEGEGGTPAGDV